MKNITRIMTMMLAMLSPAIQAATAATDDTDNKVKFSPVGTLVMDGALFASPQKSDFPDGAAIPDVRLGVMADMGKWCAKIEAGFAYGKVLLKDVWMQYTFSQSDQIRVGLQMQHFGYQNSTAACMKVTMIEPICNTIFNDPPHDWSDMVS